MKVRFSRTFVKQYHKAGVKIQSAFEKRLRLFMKNPNHPQLRNHSLKNILKGLRSINITGDWRALYSEYKQNGELIVIFELLGTHSQLYK